MVRESKIYTTIVDKSGSILVLDYSVMERDVKNRLEHCKYQKLGSDPRDRIRKETIGLVNKYVSSGQLKLQDRLYLTGVTEKGGYSHDPSFCCSSPYIYPLYKLHKLKIDAIEKNVIPPTRMVTSGVNGPTYRIGVFLVNQLLNCLVRVNW